MGRVARRLRLASGVALLVAVVAPMSACRSDRDDGRHDECDDGSCDDGGHDGGSDTGEPSDGNTAADVPVDPAACVADAGPAADSLGLCENGWCWQNPLPQGNDLNAVVVVAPNDVWALGATSLHYDGVKWAAKGSLPRGAIVRAAWASSVNSIWAVADGDLVLHWDGMTWMTSSTGLGAAFTAKLRAIWGTSDMDIFVGGSSGVGHWNGSSWTTIPFMGLSTPPAITGISGSASNDVWATSGTAFHYTGTSFVQSGSGSVVSARASDDVWFGLSGTAASHWNGSGFTSFSTGIGGRPDGLAINSFWGEKANDVWASYFPSGSGCASYPGDVVHFDGIAWTHVALPRCRP